ncbi:MAG: cell division protein FtsQ/DivIB [Myxococcota bacterium]
MKFFKKKPKRKVGVKPLKSVRSLEKKTTKKKKKKIKTRVLAKKTKILTGFIKKKIFSSRVKTGLGFLCFLGLLGFGIHQGYRYLFYSEYFSLKKVKINPVVHVNSKLLLKRAKLDYGKNIFSVDLERTAAIIASDPWVSRVQVYRELPDTIQVNIEEQKDEALVLFQKYKESEQKESAEKTSFYLINSRGKIFKKASHGDLSGKVILSGISRQDFKNSRTLSQIRFKESLKLLKEYQSLENRPELSEICHNGDVFIMFLKKYGTAVYIDTKNFKRQLYYLDNFLAATDLKLKAVARIFADNRENHKRIVVVPKTIEKTEITDLSLSSKKNNDSKKNNKINDK